MTSLLLCYFLWYHCWWWPIYTFAFSVRFGTTRNGYGDFTALLISIFPPKEKKNRITMDSAKLSPFSWRCLSYLPSVGCHILFWVFKSWTPSKRLIHQHGCCMCFITTLDFLLRFQTPLCTFLEKETSKNYYPVWFARMEKQDAKAERIKHSQLSIAMNSVPLIVEYYGNWSPTEAMAFGCT